MRVGRYIRPTVGISAPRCLVSAVCEARPALDRETRHATPMVLRRVHALYAHRRRGRWQKGRPLAFDSGSDFHDWLERFASERRVTYVWAPIASNALTLTGFWNRLTAAGAVWGGRAGQGDVPRQNHGARCHYTVRTCVLRGRPDIVRYCRDSRTITWVSGRQYADQSPSQLADSVGWTRPGSDLRSGGTVVSTWHPSELCGLWLQVATRLSDWWQEVAGGWWSDTIGGLAMSYFRARLTPKTILAHQNHAAGRLETAALFGGRASVWYTGDVGNPQVGGGGGVPIPLRGPGTLETGPLTLVDVRSMYPFLLAAKPYPVALVRVLDRPGKKAAAELLADYGVVASVELEARHAEYPCRHRGRIVYPTGRFATVLCGDELARAVRSGEVVQVFQLAYYRMGRPFERMAQSLIEMRDAYRRAGQPGWELFVKLLSNSFAGKLAQRRVRWERRPDVPAEVEWGEWVRCNGDGLPGKVYRALAGLVWEKCDSPEERRTMGQCFAYLTSYGRSYMRSVREHCPPQSVVSQDTDGLWLLPAGLDALRAAGLLSTDAPGALRVVRQVDGARFWGPKHYVAGGKWTLAGLTAGVDWCGGVEFVDYNQSNPVQRNANAPPDHVEEYSRRVVLSTVPVDGTADPLGWIHPLFFTPPTPTKDDSHV